MNLAPIPPLMRTLRRDHRGIPITFTSLVLPDGRHDFTRMEMSRWFQCVDQRLCMLCGQKLVKKMWFIGGPLCMHNRFFFDLGMHEECARFALLVCPYLAVRSYTHAKVRAIKSGDGPFIDAELNSSDKEKPIAFGLACTDGYALAKVQGDTLVRAKRWIKEIEWWNAGSRIMEAPPLVLKPNRMIR